MAKSGESPQQYVSRISLVGRSQGAVKNLSGFNRKHHTVPDTVNATTTAFLAKLCAAELTAVPNDVLLETYEMLRPYRSSYYQLLSISQEIAARYDAPETGEYIRHAAEAYRAKGLLKPDDP